MKIGQSIDIHRLCAERPLIIGGVTIPHHLGLLGHSDADVLLHVIAEAILGALGLGDLGTHFPDDQDINKDRSSLDILMNVCQMMDKDNYQIGNIDATVIIEKPKLQPYVKQMAENIADCLHCLPEKVNIKATCGEGLGFIGEEKGAAAIAVVLLKGREDE